VGFVVDKAALGQVFSEYFGFPCQSFHRFFHYHNHPGGHNMPLSGRSVEWTLIPPPTMQKVKRYVILESEKKKRVFLDISTTNIDALVPSRYQCVETRSIEGFFTVALATSAPPFQPDRHLRNVFHPVVNRFTRQTLPTVNRKHFFMNILCIESFCPQ
jgi:hypothetical protein